MDDNACYCYFLEPGNTAHRRYEAVFHAISQGGVQGFGIRNSGLRSILGKTSGQVSRILKRLANIVSHYRKSALTDWARFKPRLHFGQEGKFPAEPQPVARDAFSSAGAFASCRRVLPEAC